MPRPKGGRGNGATAAETPAGQPGSVVDAVHVPGAGGAVAEDAVDAAGGELDVPIVASGRVRGPPFVLQPPGARGHLHPAGDAQAPGGVFASDGPDLDGSEQAGLGGLWGLRGVRGLRGLEGVRGLEEAWSRGPEGI